MVGLLLVFQKEVRRLELVVTEASMENGKLMKIMQGYLRQF